MRSALIATRQCETESAVYLIDHALSWETTAQAKARLACLPQLVTRVRSLLESAKAAASAGSDADSEELEEEAEEAADQDQDQDQDQGEEDEEESESAAEQQVEDAAAAVDAVVAGLPALCGSWALAACASEDGAAAAFSPVNFLLDEVGCALRPEDSPCGSGEAPAAGFGLVTVLDPWCAEYQFNCACPPSVRASPSWI